MNIMNWLQNKWKDILLILLMVMWMGGCVSRCSKNNEIRSLRTVISERDSVIAAEIVRSDSLSDVISGMRHEIDLRDVVIEQKTQSVRSLEESAKRIVVRIDTARHR